MGHGWEGGEPGDSGGGLSTLPAKNLCRHKNFQYTASIYTAMRLYTTYFIPPVYIIPPSYIILPTLYRLLSLCRLFMLLLYASSMPLLYVAIELKDLNLRSELIYIPVGTSYINLTYFWSTTFITWIPYFWSPTF